MHMLNALSEGEDFLGRECREVSVTVVYVNLELNQSMLRKYAEDMGIDLEDKHLKVLDYQGRASQLKIDDSGFRNSFAAAVKDVEGKVLVLDPLSPILSMLGIDSNDTDRVREVLENLGEMAKQAGCDLVIIDHTGHTAQGRPRNSSAKLDWPDVLWNLQLASKDETDPGRELHVGTGRGVMASTIYYRMDEDGSLVPGDEEDFDL